MIEDGQVELTPLAACAPSTQADGGHLREELLSLSDRDHTCVYRILESPLPVTGYVAGYRLLPVTEGDRTFIDWWAEYEVAPADHDQVWDQVRNGTFRRAFQAVAEKLGVAPSAPPGA